MDTQNALQMKTELEREIQRIRAERDAWKEQAEEKAEEALSWKAQLWRVIADRDFCVN